MNSLKKLIENPISAFIGSMIAVAMSILSLVFAHQAHQLSVLEFKQERYLILKGTFKDEGKSVYVASASNESYFLKGEVFFPPLIHEYSAPIDSSGKFWHMGSVMHELQELTLKHVQPESGVVKFSNGDIPIIIKSYYASKGEAYTDVSLYMLGMEVFIEDKEYSRPRITLNSLSFVQRLDPNIPINQAQLNDFVNNKGNWYLPTNQP
ncbi:hypothetical protein [Cellvibrio polysaccharolyticus]|uniref:Uncharacterized protein n=1 Tax=Cellvibrio polysaccharolyticus TaxID=2082724 RepID=A0A928YVL2_9GAMM|nr:hypothetical protein [Cellvibrio polysaccharolyticus]MBE8717193.1 hypothetical protein [Cellvibrio polysaccharolyticus]